MPDGEIRATIDLFPAAVQDRGRDDVPLKVRLVIWSGPDFRTPTIVRGAIFEDPVAARYAADKAIEACELLGIPVEGAPDGHEPAEPHLPPGPGEDGDYARVAA